ncbi:MAG: hypothetical protein R3F11_18690 [Verrucomicrobiales bacterium]
MFFKIDHPDYLLAQRVIAAATRDSSRSVTGRCIFHPETDFERHWLQGKAIGGCACGAPIS